MRSPFNALRHALAYSVALLALASSARAQRALDIKPNIIFILTDDQGYGDLGSYGSTTIRTPRLDRMAEEGLRLTSCYSAPICGPARAALLTGSYPARVMRLWTLPPEEITIAELLKPAGYATACIGKWDLSRRGYVDGRIPNDQGFDYYFGTLGANDSGRIVLYRNRSDLGPTTDMGSLTGTFTDEAITYIAKNKDRPFFLYLAHVMPHIKIDASARFRGKSAGGLYGDVIEEIDSNVGRILDAVRDHGLEERTIVVFMSDNGPWTLMRENGAGSAGPLRGSKRSTYEGGIRVPGIIWGPGLVPGGRVNDGIVSATDFFATFAYLAGVRVPDDRVLDSIDQTPLFTGRSVVSARDHFLYYSYHGAGLAEPVLRAVRQGNWKLVTPTAPQYAPQLFDLTADISETRNLALQNPGLVQQLLAIAEAANADIGNTWSPGPNSRVTEDELALLRRFREERTRPRQAEVDRNHSSDRGASPKVAP
jgi:arylsulfatase